MPVTRRHRDDQLTGQAPRQCIEFHSLLSQREHEALIRLVVSVGVPEEEQVRPRGDQHAPIPKLEAKRVVNFGEFDHPVGFSVPVLIGQNKKSVVHFLKGFPLGVGGPCGGPEPSLGVYLQLNGVDQFGKLHLIGEKIHFESLADRYAFSTLLGAEILGRTFLARIRASASTSYVRYDLDRWGDVGVVDFMLFPLGGGPNELVPIGGHDVEHDQFVLKDLGIGLVVNEAQAGTASPDVIPVGCPVPVVPMPVFLQHGLA